MAGRAFRLIALLLVAQWPDFHRSAARAVPTPHLKWRTDQFLRQVNMVLAAYTRAQALSALIVGTICGIGFALMKLPNAAMFGIVAGLLETIPIAGPACGRHLGDRGRPVIAGAARAGVSWRA